MKTLRKAILDHFEITEADARRTVKDIVLVEAGSAKCVQHKRWCSIISGRDVLGRGLKEEDAWIDAALKILGIKMKIEGVSCVNW